MAGISAPEEATEPAEQILAEISAPGGEISLVEQILAGISAPEGKFVAVAQGSRGISALGDGARDRGGACAVGLLGCRGTWATGKGDYFSTTFTLYIFGQYLPVR